MSQRNADDPFPGSSTRISLTMRLLLSYFFGFLLWLLNGSGFCGFSDMSPSTYFVFVYLFMMFTFRCFSLCVFYVFCAGLLWQAGFINFVLPLLLLCMLSPYTSLCLCCVASCGPPLFGSLFLFLMFTSIYSCAVVLLISSVRVSSYVFWPFVFPVVQKCVCVCVCLCVRVS